MSKLGFCYISARNAVRIPVGIYAGGHFNLVVWDDGRRDDFLRVLQQEKWVVESVELDRDVGIPIERPGKEARKTDEDQRPAGIRAASECGGKNREACGAFYTPSIATHYEISSAFASKGLALRERTSRGEG